MASLRQPVIKYTIVFVNLIAILVTIWWAQVRADVRATRLGVARQYNATLSLAHLCHYKLMAPRLALEMDMSTVILVTLHVMWDTNGVEALRELVKPTDNGQERKQLVKLASVQRYDNWLLVRQNQWNACKHHRSTNKDAS